VTSANCENTSINSVFVLWDNSSSSKWPILCQVGR